MSWSPTELTMRTGPQRPQSFGTVTQPATGRIDVVEIGARTGYRQLEITLTNVPVAITQASTAGFGSVNLWTFVAGSLVVTNACLRIPAGGLTAAAGISATSNAIVVSLGTAATADATLNSTEASIIASSTVATLAASTTSAATAAAFNALTVVNGMAAGPNLVLNFGIGSGVSSASSLTVSGKVTVCFHIAEVNTADPVDF
jgi:hypothetical protein